MKIVEIPNQENAILALEKANYEVQGYQSILQYMLNNNMKDHPTYKSTWEDYLNALKTYDAEKENFRVNYIVPVVGNNFNGRWEVTFTTKEVKIYD